jgi:hypothetical protein
MSKGFFARTRALDWLALALSLGACAAFFLPAYGASGARGDIFIETPGEIRVYPLDARQELSVSGPLGETRVIVEDGGAYVADSPCRDKLCLAMGKVSRRGGWIACLPNRVFVRIDAAAAAQASGANEAEVDAAAY